MSEGYGSASGVRGDRAIPGAVLSLFRCPETFRTGFLQSSSRDIVCTGSGRVYRYADGVVDFVWRTREPSLSQQLMESEFYSVGYETVFRPALTRLVTAQTIETSMQLSVAMLRPPADGVVLDIGCGTGNFTRAMMQAMTPGTGLCVGLDLSAPMIRTAARFRDAAELGRMHLVRGDAQLLPFADGSFDAVHTSAALQLVPDPRRAVLEMARVLKPGGRVLVNTFVRSSGGLSRRMQNFMGRNTGFQWFSPERLSALLAEAGLGVVEEVIEGAAISLLAQQR
jgi:ubiquinone/menaquinone biosynthesis C-methylase UbiE